MVNVSGECAIMSISRCCHVVVKSGVEKVEPQAFTFVCDALWYSEEIKSSPEDDMGKRNKCIGQIKENYLEIFLLPVGYLNLVPDHASVSQTSR